MRDNTKVNSLVKLEEKSIIFKIKNFLYSFFKKDVLLDESVYKEKPNALKVENIEQSDIVNNDSKKEVNALELQKEYRSGKLNIEELTIEQINLLSDLYDKQIEQLERSNQIRKKKLIRKIKVGF